MEKKYLKWALFQILSLFSLLNVITKFNNFPTYLPLILLVCNRNHTYISFRPNKDLKSTAYKTLVHPQLEYASTVWSPHTDLDINKLESVQRRAARWVTRDYQYTSSVSKMLQDLNWRTLDQQRIDSRLVLLYKVTYHLMAIPASDYLMRNTRPSSRNHPDSVPTDHHSKRLL